MRLQLKIANFFPFLSVSWQSRGAQDRARTRGWIKRALMKASQRCQAAAAAASRMVKEPIESLRDSCDRDFSLNVNRRKEED